jgi:hypothetical protein
MAIVWDDRLKKNILEIGGPLIRGGGEPWLPVWICLRTCSWRMTQIPECIEITADARRSSRGLSEIQAVFTLLLESRGAVRPLFASF